MSNQTPKQRTLAARPGAYSERVTKQDGATFYRILDGDGQVLGQSTTPNKAWEVAARYVEREDRLKAVAADEVREMADAMRASIASHTYVKPQSERHTDSAWLYPEPKVTHNAPPEDGPRPRFVSAKVKQARRNANKRAAKSRRKNRAT